MKLLSLKTYNTNTKIKINKIDFQPFSLLVGASGVGKTQILDAINNLRQISQGNPKSGFSWEVEFEIDSTPYYWSGEYGEVEGDNVNNPLISFHIFGNDEEEIKPVILHEKLIVSGKEIISRDGEDIFFKGEAIVKLDPSESAINLLKQELEIAVVKKAFNKIISTTRNDFGFAYIGFIKRSKEYDADISSVEELRDNDFALPIKMYVCQEKLPVYFQQIIDTYIDIFPFVEGVMIEKYEEDMSPRGYLAFNVRVKERGIEHWINQDSMSSGMIKTFYQIAYLYLCSKGTVFLIDEFENGFGVNCINDITDVLMNTGDGMQFIITSHHPYIINNVPIDNWKIISRKAGEIKSYDANEFKLKESNHEAFTKLINLDVYSYGADI
ncbi:ATP-binding protein [Pantoea alhagi]|uniref:ATP-binding protein n=1 Tax=Pantoea alhagi TaxID=1891675 RepID=UPI00202AE4B5|nr:ATP-binding protein [Pantoea alhagi]URQ60040.1 ATP-binding protein [Pantoea alhagi]